MHTSAARTLEPSRRNQRGEAGLDICFGGFFESPSASAWLENARQPKRRPEAVADSLDWAEGREIALRLITHNLILSAKAV